MIAATIPYARTLLAVLALAACSAAPRGSRGVSALATADSAAILRDVRYLASDALEGRATGTPGNDSAAAYIARRYSALGLAPLVVDSSRAACASLSPVPCGPRWTQYFVARSAALAHTRQPFELTTQNVVALIRGSDRQLRDEYVVLGAHFDHLGRSTVGALDPDAGNAIHNGADDNASGTAAIMELARLLARRPPRRSVLLAHFSGEELGLLGSQYFVEHSPVDLARVRAMLNFDMVGRLREDRLMVYGVATAAELPAIVDSANRAGTLRITAIGDGFGSSDHSSFYARNLPVLHFFTNVHDDYHRATDDAEKVFVGGIARVVTLAERIVRDIADRPAPLTFTRTAPQPSRMGPASREGARAYLGSVPDMGASGGEGLRIAGVQAGSPAETGGLKTGDVVVELGGKPVKDLYQYTDALYAHQPGDTITIVVMRDGQRLPLTVTLGKRGG